MKQKLKQRITDPFWEESTSHWWIPWIPLTMRKAFPYHDVNVFRFICTLWLWHRRCKNLSIFYTGSFSRLITDRINKATRVSHMVLQALRVDQNVSPRLSLSLFDKQIVPILLYGAAVWSAPRTHNFIYLLNQTGSDTTRYLVQNVLNGISDSQIPFVYAKRVGKKPKQGTPDLRKILIKLQNYKHKEILLRENKHLFTDYIDNNDSSIQNVHNYFCKRSLNVNEYASTSAVKYELGRFHITHKAWGHAVKYWLRLESGTGHTILNEAYLEAKQNNHEWVQGIQYLPGLQIFIFGLRTYVNTISTWISLPTSNI